MTATDQRPLAGDQGDSVDGLVRAALSVPGVRAVRVEPDEDGVALLRLELEPGRHLPPRTRAGVASSPTVTQASPDSRRPPDGCRG